MLADAPAAGLTAQNALWHVGMQLAANPFATQLFSMTEVVRGLSPGLVKQVLPLVDQLTPLYMEVSQGRVEFSPHPSETQNMAKSYYGECLG